jgi:predicted RNA-binding protein
MASSRQEVEWRVIINADNWDQSKYEREWAMRPEQKRFAQTKGTARMVVVPRKNERINFVMKGEIVMRGYVESEGFIQGEIHKEEHSCVKGTLRDRPWDHINEYAWVKITEVGLNEPIKRTGQRTWAKMPQ